MVILSLVINEALVHWGVWTSNDYNKSDGEKENQK